MEAEKARAIYASSNIGYTFMSHTILDLEKQLYLIEIGLKRTWNAEDRLEELYILQGPSQMLEAEQHIKELDS